MATITIDYDEFKNMESRIEKERAVFEEEKKKYDEGLTKVKITKRGASYSLAPPKYLTSTILVDEIYISRDDIIEKILKLSNKVDKLERDNADLLRRSTESELKHKNTKKRSLFDRS